MHLQSREPRFVDGLPTLALRVLAVGAIVLVLLPTCSMAMQGMSLAHVLDCDSVWLASDAPGAVLVSAIMLVIASAFALLTRANPFVKAQALICPAYTDARQTGPPGDPLVGRLLI